mgnify:CR=1 FL=1
MEVGEVWVLYQTEPTDVVRNYLIENYLPLVRYTAERMHTRLPSEVDVEDLMSSGLFGLMDAIDAFDLDRGVKFETYRTQRIRGAIFDELRAMDWVPRLVRSRTAKVEKARRSFEMQHGRRRPTPRSATGWRSTRTTSGSCPAKRGPSASIQSLQNAPTLRLVRHANCLR